MIQALSQAVSIACLVALWVSAADRNAQGAEQDAPKAVSATSLRGKVMCGYQGWFRCPGDGSNLGWIHWSRDSRRIAPGTLTFEMWPDMSEYSADERFVAPGFSFADGSPATLFSSANAKTVLRHFEWMRDYGIDGAWLQHFVVDLPGGPSQDRYASRRLTLDHVAAAAEQTGRVWALTYDISGMPAERLFQVLTDDWKKMVDDKIAGHPRYLRQDDLPVVQVWGFYRRSPGIAMTAELAGKLIDFFHAPGPYRAYLVGGGDWDWRSNADPQWQECYRRLDAYVPWNIGNYATDTAGVKHRSHEVLGATIAASASGTETLWIPSVYPGFSWDNLQQKPPGTTGIPRRGGQVLLGAVSRAGSARRRYGLCGHVRRSGRRDGNLQSHQRAASASALCRLRRLAQRLVSAADRRGGSDAPQRAAALRRAADSAVAVGYVAPKAGRLRPNCGPVWYRSQNSSGDRIRTCDTRLMKPLL